MTTCIYLTLGHYISMFYNGAVTACDTAYLYMFYSGAVTALTVIIRVLGQHYTSFLAML